MDGWLERGLHQDLIVEDTKGKLQEFACRLKSYKVYRLLCDRDLPLALGAFSKETIVLYCDLDHYFDRIIKKFADLQVPGRAPSYYCALVPTTNSSHVHGDSDDAAVVEMMMKISDEVARSKYSGTLSSQRFAALGVERQRGVVQKLHKTLLDSGHGNLTHVELIEPAFSAPRSLWWAIHRVSVFAVIRTLCYGVEFGASPGMQRLETFFSSIKIQKIYLLPRTISHMDTRGYNIDWKSLQDCKNMGFGR